MLRYNTNSLRVASVSTSKVKPKKRTHRIFSEQSTQRPLTVNTEIGPQKIYRTRIWNSYKWSVVSLNSMVQWKRRTCVMVDTHHWAQDESDTRNAGRCMYTTCFMKGGQHHTKYSKKLPSTRLKIINSIYHRGNYNYRRFRANTCRININVF